MKHLHYFFSIILCSIIFQATAQIELDNQFGEDGKVIHNIGFAEGSLRAILALPDGRTILAGPTQFNGKNNFSIVSLLESGTIDQSFGDNGFVYTNWNTEDQDVGLMLQGTPNSTANKIIVLTETYEEDSRGITIARYDLQGNIDASFGGNGTGNVMVETPIGYTISYSGAALSPGGKILIIGHISGPDGFDIVVYQLTVDGLLDTNNFGLGSGKVQIDIAANSPASTDYGADVTVLPDGTIYVAATSDGQAAVLALEANGDLLASFDNGSGIRIIELPFQPILRNIEFDPVQNDLLIGGYSAYNPDPSDIFFARLTLEGESTGFFGQGFLLEDPTGTESEDRLADMKIDENGKIVFISKVYLDGQPFVSIYRYLPTGEKDPSFLGGNFSIPNIKPEPTVLDIQNDGKIIIAGESEFDFQISQSFVTRMEENGLLDNSFGNNGHQILQLGHSFDVVYDLLEKGGKIYTAGYTQGDFIIERFEENGEHDLSFGDEGKALFDFDRDGLYTIDLKEQGNKLLLAGTVSNYALWTRDYNFFLMRVNEDGIPDPTFGDNGKTITNIGASGVSTIDFQSNGKIIAMGSGSSSNIHSDYIGLQFAVARYDSNGHLDQSFGGNGTGYTLLGSLTEASWGYLGWVHNDNRIVVGGRTVQDDQGDISLYRLLENGLPDNSFNNTGNQRIVLPESDERARAIHYHNNKYTIVGTTCNQSEHCNFLLIRLNNDGSLDDTFGSNGIQFFDFGFDDDRAYALLVDEEDRLIVSGTSNENFAVAIFDDSGNLVESSCGYLNTSVDLQQPSVNEVAYTSLLRPDGNFYLGGFSFGDMAIVRFALDCLTPVEEMNQHSFYLQQNVPNPFVETTSIIYELSSTLEVQLMVHDVFGRKVQELVNTKQAAGSYIVDFSASKNGLNPGIYWCTLRTEGISQTIKMIISGR